ncbi:hypothetical protein HK096_000102 [Nowakowskiella sp. JEL0078]|nr:hypothetical protein HK096_000102 [Nowakowskiella sp. JEL0078]
MTSEIPESSSHSRNRDVEMRNHENQESGVGTMTEKGKPLSFRKVAIVEKPGDVETLVERAMNTKSN